MPGREQVIAWAHGSQQTLLRDALIASNLQLAAVGSDDLSAAAALSDALGVQRETDLRHALHRPGVSMVWFLVPRCLTEDEVRVLRERRVRTLCLHPPIISVSDAAGDASEHLEARFGPLMQVSAAFRAASDVLEPFGERRSLQIFMSGGSMEGSTAARLFDAMALVHRLLGSAESVMASTTSTLAGSLDALDQLRGSMNVHVQCAARASASITVSCDAGRWRRSMSVVGDGGMLTLDDAGFLWTDPDGRVAAEHHVPPPHGAGRLFGEQAARWLVQADAADIPHDPATVLAMCEAARLSCLTGQPEHPARVMEMLSKP